MTNHYLSLFLFLLWSISGMGQSIQPQVVAPSGSHVTSPDAQLSWTLGEAITTTVGDNSKTITQGFQQPDGGPTAVKEIRVEALKLSVFPNPSQGAITLTSDVPTNLQLAVFDMVGQMVWQGKLVGTQREIDLAAQPAGIYFLRVTSSDAQITSTHKIQLL